MCDDRTTELERRLAAATRFEFGNDVFVDRLRIESRGGDRWAVAAGPTGYVEVMNTAGDWEDEPSQSDRDAAFFNRARFSLDEAFARVDMILGGPDGTAG